MKKLAALLLSIALAWLPHIYAQSVTTAANSAVPIPFIGRSGTTLPAKCTLGEVFFKTDATAGQNLYMCTAADTWTQQLNSGAGSGSITASGYTMNTSKMLGRATASSGAIEEIAVTGSGSAVLSASPALTGTPTVGSSGSAGAISFGNATSGTLTVSPVTGALGTATLKLPIGVGNGTAAQVIASGAKALATSAISSGACSSAQTDTATGTATTDVIQVTFAADPTSTTGYAASTSGGLHIVSYPTADTVNFKVCNNTGSSITPGAVTLNWRVVR